MTILKKSIERHWTGFIEQKLLRTADNAEQMIRLHANAKDNVHYTYIKIKYIFPLPLRSEKLGYFINLGEMNNSCLL